MDTSSTWERYYRETPLEKVPWQKTQADYFTEVIDVGKVQPCSALDLGCGTGVKSIYLAKRGFRVTGVDISETAIKFAKENAQKARIEVEFVTADATDLDFLKNKRFDFVLDWANLHGISEDKRGKYVQEVAKHTRKSGKLLLRCFSKRGVGKSSVLREMGRIYLFSKEDIENLFGDYFRTVETNESKPFTRRARKPPAKWLDEYLMERV